MDLSEALYAVDEIVASIRTRAGFLMYTGCFLILFFGFGFLVVVGDLGSSMYFVLQREDTIVNAFTVNPILNALAGGDAYAGAFWASIIIVCLTFLSSVSQIAFLRGVRVSCLVALLFKASIIFDLWTDFPGVHATLGGWPQPKDIPLAADGSLPAGIPLTASGIFTDTVTKTVWTNGYPTPVVEFTPGTWDFVLHGLWTMSATLFVSVCAQVITLASLAGFLMSFLGIFGIRLRRKHGR
jgi:hypothetical protein